jgi:hypothetical protein
VIKPTTVRLILPISVSKGWCICQADVNNAFLKGDPQETMFMKQPLGFTSLIHPQHVCRVQKALYGLKQAPRAWHSNLSSKLCSLKFRPCNTNTCLIIYMTNHLTIGILVCVDNLIIISSSSSATTHLL